MAAEDTAQGVLDKIGEDAAAFPWFDAILEWLIVCAIMWLLVEAIKAYFKARLPRQPRKGASERTVVQAISKKHPAYLLIIWGVSVFGGAAIGLLWALGDLAWWYAMVIGAFSGVTNAIGMKLLRGLGDKSSDFLLGWLKRWLGRRREGDEANPEDPR